MWEDERCLSHVLPYHMFFFFNNVVNYVSAFGITVIFGVAYGYYGQKYFFNNIINYEGLFIEKDSNKF